MVFALSFSLANIWLGSHVSTSRLSETSRQLLARGGLASAGQFSGSYGSDYDYDQLSWYA